MQTSCQQAWLPTLGVLPSCLLQNCAWSSDPESQCTDTEKHAGLWEVGRAHWEGYTHGVVDDLTAAVMCCISLALCSPVVLPVVSRTLLLPRFYAQYKPG